MKSVYLFQALAFAIGFFTMMTPGLILEYLGKADNYRSEFCLGSHSLADLVTIYTLYSLLAQVLLLFIVFKWIQPAGSRFWFSLKSNYFWPNLVLAGSLVVYQFSHSLFMTLFIFPLLQSAGSLRHSFKSALLTLVLLAVFFTFDVLALFGPVIAGNIGGSG